ncbi:MAG: tyrosine-type recombinase/integrase [Polaromonas sp.]|nr:tyrosine-type recombinase/integrase [Polaromonas sp.]MBP8873507.1 tyrosine-type recombinase/integrase [Polaromonas sp.]
MGTLPIEINATAPKKRKSKPKSVLTDKGVKNAKPQDKPYKLTDGNGLHLLISPSGAKLWRYRYTYAGKEKLMSLGAYPVVSLSDARQAHLEARKQLSTVDPMELRKTEKKAKLLDAENSFKSAALLWWNNWKNTRSSQHALQVKARFEQNIFPYIGARPVAQIESPELVTMLKSIEARGVSDVAKRALQTSGQVFRYAIAHGLAKRNPAADIKPSDILKPVAKRNLARIDGKDLPELLRKIEAYQGTPITRLAMKLMALTFVRTSELIGARWAEFDLEAGRWEIPKERMKMKTPHIVPLAAQTVNLLKTLQLVTGHTDLLFYGERDHNKPMSNNTILQALKRMGYAGLMTGHGFRGVASTLLHEQGFDHAHIELQLAHMERNQVSAAYNHATYLPQRFTMMQAWADYLDACMTGKVIKVDFRKSA